MIINSFQNAYAKKFAEIIKKVAKETLTPEYELYDFGGGWVVAPAPELNQIDDLTHVVAVIQKEQPYKCTWFKVDLFNLSFETLKKDMTKAIEHNKTQTQDREMI